MVGKRDGRAGARDEGNAFNAAFISRLAPPLTSSLSFPQVLAQPQLPCTPAPTALVRPPARALLRIAKAQRRLTRYASSGQERPVRRSTALAVRTSMGSWKPLSADAGADCDAASISLGHRDRRG